MAFPGTVEIRDLLARELKRKGVRALSGVPTKPPILDPAVLYRRVTRAVTVTEDTKQRASSRDSERRLCCSRVDG